MTVTTKPDYLRCVCGTVVKTTSERLADLAKRLGWTFYPHSPHLDGTNAECAECKALDEDGY